MARNNSNLSVARSIRMSTPQGCCIRNNVLTAKTIWRQTRKCRVQRNVKFIYKNDVLRKLNLEMICWFWRWSKMVWIGIGLDKTVRIGLGRERLFVVIKIRLSIVLAIIRIICVLWSCGQRWLGQLKSGQQSKPVRRQAGASSAMKGAAAGWRVVSGR